MTRIEKTMEIKAPVEKVFAFCANIEGYTAFMTGVKEITKTSDTKYHWKMETGGRTIEFDTEPTEIIENRKVAWTSTGDFTSNGSWTFEPTDGGTKCAYVMDYEIPGLIGKIFDKVTISKEMEKGMENSLQKMKELLEG